MKLTIGHLYPDLLNLYGDRGNIQCLKMRLIWRGIEAEVREFRLGDTIDFAHLDVVLLGGGSDREQMIVCRRLQEIRKSFHDYVEDGGVTLAVCGGYQLLGHYYSTPEGKMEGLSLCDLYTEQGSPRLISNIVIRSDLLPYPIAGFENHGGRTYLGSEMQPLGDVLFGCGNNGEDGHEGVLWKKCRRHLPARPAPAEEPPPVRPAAQPRAGAALRRRHPGAARRHAGEGSQRLYRAAVCAGGVSGGRRRMRKKMIGTRPPCTESVITDPAAECRRGRHTIQGSHNGGTP